MANYSLISFQVIITLAMVFVCSSSADQLRPDFYSKTCPNISNIVEQVVRSAIKIEPRMGASLLRLHFHDCFVKGCDASILLDKTRSFDSEKNALPNNNSVRGFEVIDLIKTNLEAACRGVVSCADILAIAAMQSVKILVPDDGKWCGWNVPLGRRDSETAYKNLAESGHIPSPASKLNQLIDLFKKNNLTTQDLIALSGAHTIGVTRCTVFRSRIYNETNIDGKFAAAARKNCRPNNKGDDEKLQPLDKSSPYVFDNAYFNDVKNKKTLLGSDQQLLNTTDVDIIKLVNKFSDHQISFLESFGKAMVRMGNISPLTGTEGQIRTKCNRVNNK